MRQSAFRIGQDHSRLDHGFGVGERHAKTAWIHHEMITSGERNDRSAGEPRCNSRFRSIGPARIVRSFLLARTDGAAGCVSVHPLNWLDALAGLRARAVGSRRALPRSVRDLTSCKSQPRDWIAPVAEIADGTAAIFDDACRGPSRIRCFDPEHHCDSEDRIAPAAGKDDERNECDRLRYRS